MGLLDKLRKLAQTAVKSGETLGTQVYRKSAKPFRHYMAPERAQKIIEQQQKVPRRAPMNVSKLHFPKEKVEANKVAVHEMLKKSDEIIKKINRMKIVSSEAEGKIKSPHPKPQNRTASSPVKYTDEIPRGLISIQDCIDLLYNHHLNKEEWTAEKLAERFRLRATDVENLIENFKLLESEDKL